MPSLSYCFQVKANSARQISRAYLLGDCQRLFEVALRQRDQPLVMQTRAFIGWRFILGAHVTRRFLCSLSSLQYRYQGSAGRRWRQEASVVICSTRTPRRSNQ